MAILLGARHYFGNQRIPVVTQARQSVDLSLAGRDSKSTGRIPIQLNGAGIMANTQDTQDNPLHAEHAAPQPTTLTDEELGSVAAGDGDPLVIPLCGLQPNKRVATQKYIDDIKEAGGEVYSYNLDTGHVRFKPGPGIPVQEIPAG
jgi:hypothetical protein